MKRELLPEGSMSGLADPLSKLGCCCWFLIQKVTGPWADPLMLPSYMLR